MIAKVLTHYLKWNHFEEIHKYSHFKNDISKFERKQ